MVHFVPSVCSLFALTNAAATVSASATNPLGGGARGLFGNRWPGGRPGGSGSTAGVIEGELLPLTTTTAAAPTAPHGSLVPIAMRVAEFVLASEVISALPAPATSVITAINAFVLLLWDFADDDASLRRFVERHFLHRMKFVCTQADEISGQAKDKVATRLVINGAVLLPWHFTDDDASLCRFMERHFVHTRHFVERAGRTKDKVATRLVSSPHTVLTSAFSQRDPSHFASNMGALAFFGNKVLQSMGNRAFSYFYVASVYASKFFNIWCYHPNFDSTASKRTLFFSRRQLTSSLGASGAVSAVVAYYCLRFPTDWLKLSDIISPPNIADENVKNQTESAVDGIYEKARVRAWALGLFYVASDVFRLNGDSIGGSVFGAAVHVANVLCGARIREAAAAAMPDINVVTRPLRGALTGLRTVFGCACKAALARTKPLQVVLDGALKCVVGTFGAIFGKMLKWACLVMDALFTVVGGTFWKVSGWARLGIDAMTAAVLEVVDFDG